MDGKCYQISYIAAPWILWLSFLGHFEARPLLFHPLRLSTTWTTTPQRRSWGQILGRTCHTAWGDSHGDNNPNFEWEQLYNPVSLAAVQLPGWIRLVNSTQLDQLKVWYFLHLHTRHGIYMGSLLLSHDWPRSLTSTFKRRVAAIRAHSFWFPAWIDPRLPRGASIQLESHLLDPFLELARRCTPQPWILLATRRPSGNDQSSSRNSKQDTFHSTESNPFN
jgi:hypothetical protein